MTRRNGFSIFIIILMTTLIGLVLLAISPLWLSALVINPKVFSPLSNLAMQRVTKEVTKMMFKGMK